MSNLQKAIAFTEHDTSNQYDVNIIRDKISAGLVNGDVLNVQGQRLVYQDGKLNAQMLIDGQWQTTKVNDSAPQELDDFLVGVAVQNARL